MVSWRAFLAMAVLVPLLGGPVDGGAQPKSKDTAVKAPAEGATMVVKVKGFRDRKGRLLLAIYNSEEKWLELDKAVRVVRAPIKAGEVVVKITGLAPGIYGVSAVHDADEDDELDMRWFPWPAIAEGAAVSNNPAPGLGPPSWKEAKMKHGAAGTKVALKLLY